MKLIPTILSGSARHGKNVPRITLHVVGGSGTYSIGDFYNADITPASLDLTVTCTKDGHKVRTEYQGVSTVSVEADPDTDIVVSGVFIEYLLYSIRDTGDYTLSLLRIENTAIAALYSMLTVAHVELCNNADMILYGSVQTLDLKDQIISSFVFDDAIPAITAERSLIKDVIINHATIDENYKLTAPVEDVRFSNCVWPHTYTFADNPYLKKLNLDNSNRPQDPGLIVVNLDALHLTKLYVGNDYIEEIREAHVDAVDGDVSFNCPSLTRLDTSDIKNCAFFSLYTDGEIGDVNLSAIETEGVEISLIRSPEAPSTPYTFSLPQKVGKLSLYGFGGVHLDLEYDQYLTTLSLEYTDIDTLIYSGTRSDIANIIANQITNQSSMSHEEASLKTGGEYISIVETAASARNWTITYF